MIDSISRERVRNDLATLFKNNKELIDEWLVNAVDDVIDEQPQINATENTVEAEPIKHGRWLRTDAYPHRIYCSECFATFIRNDEFLRLEDIPHAYCPNCGAKMDEVKE